MRKKNARFLVLLFYKRVVKQSKKTITFQLEMCGAKREIDSFPIRFSRTTGIKRPYLR